MREILFRGKEIRRGHWKYGNLIMDYVGIAFRPVIQDIRDAPEKIACSYLVNPDTIGQYMANDMNGNRIFEGDIVRYYHHKKSLVPVADIKPEEDHYGKDEESGLPLAYRTTKIIRYKGHVELRPIWGMDINLNNRCQWWKNLNFEDDSINSDRLEVIGNIHDNPELLEGKS